MISYMYIYNQSDTQIKDINNPFKSIRIQNITIINNNFGR